MAVYRDLRVEIPKEHVVIERQKTGPALIKYVLEAHYDSKKGYPVVKRTTIGHQCSDSETSMHPTSQYREIFPSQWEELTNERAGEKTIRFGLFSACQAINSVCGLKDILDESYGVDCANTVMDYAVGSVLFQSDEVSGFETRMKDQLTYAEKPLSDSGYSCFFEAGLPEKDELLFRRKWALQCKEDGVKEVWLCIDGLSENYEGQGVEIAEESAKPGEDVTDVCFMYAVSANGLPVTYDVYSGSLVDAEALKEITDFLSECGIKIRGVILGRGYCDAKSICFLAEKQIEYIIMLREDSDGYAKVAAEFGDQIKLQAEYWIPGTALFGIQRPIQLFEGFGHEDYVTLFFDHQNREDRIDTVIGKMNAEIERLEKGLQNGEYVSVCDEFSAILSVSGGSEKAVDINTPALQAVFDSMGLYGVVTSAPVSPGELYRNLQLRHESEIAYRTVKTQAGVGIERFQYTVEVRARLSAGFVASVLRYKLEQASKSLGTSVGQVVQDLQQLKAKKVNNAYIYESCNNDTVNGVFRYLGVDSDTVIEESVRFMNDRLAGRVPTAPHRKSRAQKEPQPTIQDSVESRVPNRRGVKKGTKRSEVNKDGTPRKRPGVKPGTKRGEFNKDGTPRKKPGPRPKSE